MLNSDVDCLFISLDCHCQAIFRFFFFFSYSVVFKSHNIAHNSLFLGSIYAKFVNSLKCFNTPFFFANILLATSVAILLPKQPLFCHQSAVIRLSLLFVANMPLLTFCKIPLCLADSTSNLVTHCRLQDIITGFHSKLKASSSLYLEFEGGTLVYHPYHIQHILIFLID